MQGVGGKTMKEGAKRCRGRREEVRSFLFMACVCVCVCVCARTRTHACMHQLTLNSGSITPQNKAIDNDNEICKCVHVYGCTRKKKEACKVHIEA